MTPARRRPHSPRPRPHRRRRPRPLQVPRRPRPPTGPGTGHGQGRCAATQAAPAWRSSAHAETDAHAESDAHPLRWTGCGHRAPAAERPGAARPCLLVTKTEAAAAIGRPVAEPQHLPQGPTCAYQTVSGRSYVTLGVQRLRLSSLKRRLSAVRAVSAAGRRAYCGVYGQPTLILALAPRRPALNGPCGVATRSPLPLPRGSEAGRARLRARRRPCGRARLRARRRPCGRARPAPCAAGS